MVGLGGRGRVRASIRAAIGQRRVRVRGWRRVRVRVRVRVRASIRAAIGQRGGRQRHVVKRE
eukprot:scaffold12685_cov42-Phaeocystis_antarctica.AAC.1